MHSLDAGLYVDEAAAALAETHVFVSREVSGGDALTDSLVQQIGDASIGVAVFSDNAALEASPTDILEELEEVTGFDTVIVVVGDDLVAGSDALPPDEAMRIANEAESSAAGVDAALSQTIQSVIAQAPEQPALEGADAGPVIGIALAVAAVVAAGGVIFGVVRVRRRRGLAGHRPPPDKVRSLVAQLNGLRAEYAAAGASGSPVATEVAREITSIAGNTTELFDRLDRTGDEGQRSVAALEYGETLRKLTAALDRDYLLDILRHPDLWDDPAERIDEVRGAVAAFSAELVENIKQVNARRGLHFQVSLDGLIGGRKELREWDREFQRAAGDEPDQSGRPGSAD
ncbi:hypothetical protein [Microbacterium sp. CFBP9034]|uniref:hypothetical protein n=1 Tax=Microbacterium sp. CFBP9034 TaxID=3096540 RepID=UPI002A6A0D43|nr:hypothetical protein [Microbacterium sp. CFBP9034]MDY0908316.1 hypothetical protein [Microbacterium sp. CFBP9034]